MEIKLKLLASTLLQIICTYTIIPLVTSIIAIGNEYRAILLAIEKAPIVWLCDEEKFFPSNVSTFLREVTPTKINCTDCAYPASELPIGPESGEYYLITKESVEDLLEKKSSIIYGSNPAYTNVETYAHLTPCDSEYNHFIITYWFFYPFNFGKDFCTVSLGSTLIPVLELFNKCFGKTRTFGNHVGDWEHISLEIKNSTPVSMYLSVHHVGVYYLYDKESDNFVLQYASSKGLEGAQDPPKTVSLSNGRPVVLSANGSHALWGAEGRYKFTDLKLSQLADVANYGTAWETWRALKVFYSDDTTPAWFDYQGKWGNPKSNCQDLLGIEICLYSDGPNGLSTRNLNIVC